ncbi:MAG: general secretion pathway protein GspK, partial [candidate division NC10 bacterium]|nr:general secretion pathway protein GspK [candidate division NC10 bacterium]
MVVLWILAFLSVVFTAFTFSMRTELAAAGNFRQEAEAYYLAEAGVYRAAAEIINADRDFPPDSKSYDALDEHWHTNPAAYENVALGGGHYWVAVRDEESKIPLNGQITPQYDAMLRRLFSNSGVRDEKLLSTIVDSIQDWRDADTLHRLSGAEDDYYLSLPSPYRAKNANFESIDELLLVKGMTSEILYGNIASPQRLKELGDQPSWERNLKPGEYLGVARHLSL